MKNKHVVPAGKRFLGLGMNIVFAVFVFIYFYYFQSPLLSLAQHQLSEGQTEYHPLIGAIVLTMVLFVVQHKVHSYVHFRSSTFALSYVPSVVLAVLPTAFTPYPNYSILISCFVVLLVWLALCFGRGNFLFLSNENRKLSLGQFIGYQSLIFVFLMGFLGLCSNHTELEDYEIRTSLFIQENKYEEALEVGKDSDVSSSLLTALRSYALTKTSTSIGEQLFHYSIPTGGSDVLYIDVSDSLKTLFDISLIYELIGVLPDKNEKPIDYFRRVAYSDSLHHSSSSDYYLCGLLLDRNLKQFVKEIPSFYDLSSFASLPRHYREALLLAEKNGLTDMNSNYDLELLNQYREFYHVFRFNSEVDVRMNKLYKDYSQTYWWYYYFNENRNC